MAIPTQFSVTSTRTSPIANPSAPQDIPQTLDAENVSIVDGAEVLSSLSSVAVDTPSALTSESGVTIPLPAELTAKVQAAIDSAVTIPAEAQAVIDAPSAATPEAAQAANTDITLINEQSFNFSNTDNGFTIENGTLTVNATSITITNTTNDMRLVRDSVDYGFSDSYIVRVRVRCTSATVQDTATVLYKNSAHGYGPDFAVSKPVTYEQGVYQVIDFNLRGDDFTQNGADGLRFDLYNQAAPESFEIDYIHIGAYESNVEPKPAKAIATPTAAASESSAPIDTPSAATSQSEAAIATPSAATSESIATIATPSTLTTVTGTLTTPPFPRNHARILYDNIAITYSVLNSTVGTTPVRAINPNTWEGWDFDTPGTWFIRFPDFVTIDTICIGAHALSKGFYSVQPFYASTVGGAFQSFAGVRMPQDNAPIMWHLDTPVTLREIEIRTGAGTGASFIKHISIGTALQMQRPFFNGHTPITDSDVTQYYSNRTESGNIIGQQIRRQGYETSADWQNLDDTWYRTYFAPFKQAAKLQPFYFAWNLLEYPEDVGFCRISQDISAPMQNGTVTKRSVSMNLLGAG